MCRKHTKTLISANTPRSEVFQVKPSTQFGYQLFYFSNLLPIYLGHNVSIPCLWYLTAQYNHIFAVIQFFRIIMDHQTNQTIFIIRQILETEYCKACKASTTIGRCLHSTNQPGTMVSGCTWQQCIRVIWFGECSSLKIAEIGRTDADCILFLYNPFINKRG